ncbi:MAG: hypothetical protein L6V90_00915 [Treponema succinifaciens]|nr:MAG: hypothetical protein L6V90_00915 [Treponema succinifaciens]
MERNLDFDTIVDRKNTDCLNMTLQFGEGFQKMCFRFGLPTWTLKLQAT